MKRGTTQASLSSKTSPILIFFLNYRKGGFFVDLFVRVSNQVAVNMYKQLGYSVYRTVIEYYSASNGEPDEDAYGESSLGQHPGGRDVYMLPIDQDTRLFQYT